MLSQEEFEKWCERLGLSPVAKKEIEIIRSSPPARHTRSGPYNVRGIFNQSEKMAHSIQSESRTVEGPAILMMEFDDEVLEIWDQPPSFTISYKGTNGRTLGHIYTADFFVLRRDSAGWEEWKPEERLIRLTSTSPNRYQLGSDKKWHCPPGEEYANHFGLYFHVHSSAEINWVLQRNYKLLLPYLNSEDGLSQ
jgi:putative transposase